MPSVPDELLDLLVKERRSYRRAFFRYNGIGPWNCWECGQIVTIDDLEVHHINGDHGDESEENLAATHGSCHARHHGKQRDMSVALAARWSHPAAAERWSQQMKSKPRVRCENCGVEVYEMHLRRHHGSRSCRRVKEAA